MIHNGNIDDLQTIIKGCGFTIDKVKEQEHGYQIRTNEGAIVNWYSSTAKVVIQGKKGVGSYFGHCKVVQFNKTHTGSLIDFVRPRNGRS